MGVTGTIRKMPNGSGGGILGPVKSILSRYNRLLTEGWWVLLGQIVVALATLFGMRAVTGVIDPSVYGIMSLVLGTATLSRNFIAYPTIQAYGRLYVEAVAHKETGLLHQIATRLLNRANLLSILMLGACGIWFGRTHFSVGLGYFLLIIHCMTENLRGLEAMRLGMSRRQKENSILSVVDAVLRPVTIVGFALLLGASVATMVLGYVLTSFLGMLIAHSGPFREQHKDEATGVEPQPYLRSMISYGMPLVPLALMGWINGLSDRYIIGGMMTTNDVGIYTAAYSLMSQPYLMANAVLSRTLTPVLYAADTAGHARRSWRIMALWLTLSIVGGLIGVAVVYFYGPQIAKLVLAEKYRSGAILFAWIAAGCTLNNVAMTLESRLYSHKRTKAVLAVESSTALLSVVICFFMVRSYGLIGAAMACPIYFGAMAIIALVLCLRNPKTL